MLYLAVLGINKPKLYIQNLHILFTTSRGRCKNSNASPTAVLRRESEKEWLQNNYFPKTSKVGQRGTAIFLESIRILYPLG